MYSTLVESLLAASRSEKGIYFVETENTEDFLSYAALLQDAKITLQTLRSKGIAQGDEVVFQFWDLKNFVRGYWTCLLGGFIPVPLPLAKQSNNALKLFNVWGQLNNPWLITDDEKIFPVLENHGQEQNGEINTLVLWSERIFPRSFVIAPDLSNSSLANADVEIEFANITPDDIAFIQFSSGSTGTPKGVSLTHANLLTNIYDLLDSLEFDINNDIFLSWKPISHDFGMIAFHIAPVVAAATQVRIPIETYLWSPVIWFQMVHKYRATILGSPNFGYRHFLKFYKRRKAKGLDWNLSCVKTIINGAEPISASLCHEFTDEMTQYGMRPEVMRPGYGLAEASLVVSLSKLGDGVTEFSVHREKMSIGDTVEFVSPENENAVLLVDCGPLFPSTEIRITDHKRKTLEDGIIGQIEIRGGNVTRAYYNNEKATAKAIDENGWVNTEDLGFIHNNRLVFASRIKEMIILGGINYFPHDIEKSILRIKGDDALNQFVACSIPEPKGEGAQLVIFVYYKKDMQAFVAIDKEVREIVADNFGISVSYVVPTRNIPKTTSGKVQRFVLREQFLRGEFDEHLLELGHTPRRLERKEGAIQKISLAEIKSRLKAIVCEEIKREQVGEDESFFELGVSSLNLLNLREVIEQRFDVCLDVSQVLDHPSISAIASILVNLINENHQSDISEKRAPSADLEEGNHRIAIVGMACRFPGGVQTPAEFWQLLKEGVDPVTDMPESRWPAESKKSLVTSQVGSLENIDQFDPYFFGISPNEAESLDPQQRLLLEVCHEAFENSGCSVPALKNSMTGVFLGISGTEYASVGRSLGHGTSTYTYTGTMFNTAAGRIAYTFGLQGPCVALDTACSSSLTAVHLGASELRAGHCDRVVAAAVGLMLSTDGHLCFSQMNALSSSGRSRSFDDGADGYIRSEGCAAVVLKRLSDAERDGDTVLAVIRGSAINHNGRSGGLTVPSGPAQEALIKAALADANVDADAIDYVEAHGSGTRLGDPQEASALNRVFAKRERSVYLGAVKSNIGHLEAVAGLAGLQKLVLSLQHNQLPKNLHFDRPNNLIDWKNSRLRVVDQLTAFSETQPLRYAGITSLGINGSNAHLVLEASQLKPEQDENLREVSDYLVTLSSRSEASLYATLENFAKADLSGFSMAEFSRATQFQRSDYPARYVTFAKDTDALQEKLKRWLERNSDNKGSTLAAENQTPRLVFMFTGQGSQYVGMAQALYQQFPLFAATLNRCAQGFEAHLGLKLIDVIYGEQGDSLQDTAVAQASIFSIEFALAHLWQSLGAEPDLVLGHSIGEYAAACFCGVMSLDDAIAMVAARGRAMKQAPAGKMMGVLADEARVRSLMGDSPNLYIAAVNAANNVTVTGTEEAVAAFAEALKKARVFTESLAIHQPYHSPLMHPVVGELKKVLEGIQFKAPNRAFYSTQTGEIVTPDSMMGRDYWCLHLCGPVQFMKALQSVGETDINTCFIEIGGTATLSGLAAQGLNKEQFQFLPSLRDGRDAWLQFNETLALCYKAGVNINWLAYHSSAQQDTHQEYQPAPLSGLPNTGFARQRVWFSAKGAAAPVTTAACTLPSPQAVAVQSQIKTSAAPKIIDAAAILDDLSAMISQVTGVAEEQLSTDTNLFSLGVDSLMLVQLDKRIQTRYRVEISLAQFFSELHTPEKLAEHIDQHMPQQARLALQAPEPEQQTNQPQASISTNNIVASDGSVLAQMQQQLSTIQQQLVSLGASSNGVVTAGMKPKAVIAKSAPAERKSIRDIVLVEDDLSDQQKDFVATLTEKLNRATPSSKTYAQTHRKHFADWIATLNFTLSTKEFTYPLVADRSKGSRFWDVDGNEYIDTAMGYGVCLFGHNPDFVTESIQEQLAKGMELGPQSAIAGEVAKRICDMTGVERVAFANTGSEAVMVALRLARCVTKRDKIVRFVTSFHGSFDGILAEVGEEGAVPMASGIVPSMVRDTMVLQYGSASSLEEIAANSGEIAAVLVETVQSRNPGLQPAEYLRELRKLTEDNGIALIFDEMITGFRVAPGGAQAYFGVKADLATYGKIIGGGLPIGLVAGKAEFMDAIDGGFWQFGNTSGPAAETTFFAGTFCKHPMTMAASLAVLKKLEEEGPALQERLTQTTADFRDRLNTLFERKQVPIIVKNFASMYRLESGAAEDMPRHSLEMNLFFRLLQLQGIYVWERRTCFISTAHSEDDLNNIYDAIDRAIDQLREGGFSFRRAGLAKPGTQSQLLPTSSEEGRMYVLTQMQGGDLAYRISGALKVEGALDAERLQSVFNTLAQRHDVLRSCYQISDGKILRKVISDFQAPAVVWHEASTQEGLHIDADKEMFNLEEGPLWRARVLELQPEQHILVLEFHHLIADGMSISILVEELAELYSGKSLTQIPAPYQTFVEKEAKYLASDDYQKQLQYWQQQFASLPEPLQLPSDRARGPINDFAGASHRFVIPAELTSQIHQLARKFSTTPFIALLASWMAWLAKVSQQQDLCVGVPFDRRSREFEQTLGMFAQTLAIRAQLPSEQSFAELVKAVAKTCGEAFSNADVPLERIIDGINVPRDLSRNPLFDAMFIYESGARRYQSMAGMPVQPVPVNSAASAFDLTIELTEQQGEIHGQLIYASRLFDSARIEMWSEGYCYFLSKLAAQPEAPLLQLSKLPPEHIARLDSFHGKTLEIDTNSAIDNFVTIAKSLPDCEALRACDRSLSYAALLEEVDSLAQHLMAQGVNSGEAVGILLQRDSQLIIAMLAVLRCGACYIPLDPEYPVQRVQYMVDHAGVKLLIARNELLEGLNFEGTVIDPSAPRDAIKSQKAFPEIKSQQLAYIIYTSGSTGRPKGVMLSHNNLSHFIAGIIEAVAFPEDTVMLGLTTVSFDIFVLEVFVTLTRIGGCVVLASEREQQDPAACVHRMQENGVNVVQMTPSRLKVMLAGHQPAEALKNVDCLLVGGEAFPAELLSTLQSVPDLHIYNVYGPTEATVWAACAELTEAKNVNLGHPLANVRAYVLGPQGQRLPAGHQGELYLAGNFLAAGYLFDEERTAEAFVDDPFVADERMYRTGDMASWTTDGKLLHHGRRDHQVKLRGYRIELPEIEKALCDLNEVEQGAVVVRELSANNPVLVAFCTTPLQIDNGDLDNRVRQQLRQFFPEYMLPSVIVRLGSMPLTPNGKIDRNRLPQKVALPETELVVEDENDDDELIAEIRGVWKQLLGDRPLSRIASFFDVGGSSFSLLMMQVEFNKRWPGLVQVPDLFAHPNIQSQRDLIASRLQGQVAAEYHRLNVGDEFWNTAANQGNRGQLVVDIDQEFVAQLGEFAKVKALQPRDVLTGLFALYLNKRLAQSSITLYWATSEGNGYQPVSLDFAELKKLEEVLASAQAQLASSRHISVPPVLEERDGALVLFKSHNQKLNSRHRRFDVQLSLAEFSGGSLKSQTDGLLQVNFDPKRISQAVIHGWINDYLRLAKALLSPSQKRVSA